MSNDSTYDHITGKIAIGQSGDDPLEFDALFYAEKGGNDFPKVLPKAIVTDADNGHRDAIAEAAGMFSQVVTEHIQPEGLKVQAQEVMAWGLEGMQRIAVGESPDQAFRWASGQRGRRPPSVRENIRRWGIALCVGARKVDSPEMPLEDVFEQVAEMFSVSSHTVESYWKPYASEIRAIFAMK